MVRLQGTSPVERRASHKIRNAILFLLLFAPVN
jgi:hypothetical protein